MDREDDTKATSISPTLSKDSYPNSEIITAEGETSNEEEEESVSQTGDDDNMDNDFKAWDDEDQTLPLDDVQTPSSVTANNIYDWSNSEWPEVEPVTTSSWDRSIEPVTSKSGGTSNGASAHNVNTSGSGLSLLKSSKSLRSSKSSLATTESDSSSLKGRLNQSDIERLKQQAEWSKEPDYFADMQPIISNNKSSTSLSTKDNGNVANKDSEVTTIASATPVSKLSYVPNDEVCTLHICYVEVDIWPNA